MRVLLSNDDGYLAPGLNALAEAVREFATELTIVAPDRDRSGVSNSLTLRRPLRVRALGDEFFCIDGTPTDCVHVALTGLMTQPPEIVITGINGGANLGDDVLYSGTVAAAMEGRLMGLPAIAVSLVGRNSSHLETAQFAIRNILKRLTRVPLSSNTLLNVNVPDIPVDRVARSTVTRLGFRHQSEPVIKCQDPAGEEIYWVGPAGAEQDAGPGTDFFAINNNEISITPLQVDLTRHDQLNAIKSWLKQ